ncbi:MAG: flagellar protein FliT [Thioalkalispiraceae bacterium]|jgi:hypothetical protein
MQYLSLQQCADKILRLTQRMLQYARSSEWELMGSLELERGKALEHLFRHPDIKQSMQIISKTLYEVMELDKTCMELTEQARQVMLKQLNHQSQGERALNVYRENAP